MKPTPEERASALLQMLTLDEKIHQVTAAMYFDVGGDYESRRDPLCGSYRNPGHFMHYQRKTPAAPAEVAAKINRDVQSSIDAQPHRIPPIENGEALHSAQWGMGTNFPQPIGLASSFDPALALRVADAIGKECAAVGVRQVFAPVVNLTRDCRWGRTVETFGEDVKLTSDFGAAMCRGFEQNGVIATPKHFADNYSFGGRDSNYAETSERTMRETILPPFKACFDAGAQSVMAAYNGWEGVPCSANRRLLTEILRDDWGFQGFVVSDYCGVEGLRTAHRMADSDAKAAALSLRAGLDVILPFNSFDAVKEALSKGFLTQEQLDKNVLRVLTAKFRLGLFDHPFCDETKADAIVRSKAHRALALEAAREAIVLLKNDNVLPLDQNNVRRIGVFGQSAKLIPIGSNYSGPYRAPWQGDDAPTSFQALQEYLKDGAEVIFGESADIETLAPTCDVNLYFTSILEGEGSDRSDLRLPSVARHRSDETAGGLIVDAAAQTITESQEDAILRLCRADPNAVVILLNGAPVDMSAWVDAAPAIIEAWYPGEQGARALTEILFGAVSPSGKLPITVPKSVGQLPLFYAHKPSGRGYAYCDNDGKALFAFGFGLSYTSFEISDACVRVTQDGAEISFTVKNTGAFDGAEVVQLYLASHDCAVVRPVKELKAYTRVVLKRGEARQTALTLSKDTFCYYDAAMRYGLHDGMHTLLLGTSSEDVCASFELRVKDAILSDASAEPPKTTNQKGVPGMKQSFYDEFTIQENRFWKENEYVRMTPEDKALPTYEQEKSRLPRPVWDGHDDALRCYDKTWALAFSNLCKPTPGTGFVSNFIDTAFNGCIFMWDSAFILMFGKYGARSFDFQGTLNNLYSHQYADGYICREIEEDTGRDHFTRFDPAATGPDILAWCEWEYYKNFGDRERLTRVFPCLMAYHEWMRANHTWRDGTYWSSGWGCGMDNLPRLQEDYHVAFSHGHMVWNDACMQELMNCKILMEMASVLGREADTAGLQEERDHLIRVVNETLWDDKSAFYYDLWKNGRQNGVKHIGAYWALLAEIVPKDKAERFIAHLTNPSEFATACMVPALSADHPAFSRTGDYWNGGVWAPTNYMVLCGLDRYQRFDLSHRIGLNYVNNVVSVFNDTGTVFENYAPCPDENGKPRKGSPARGDFVGWTGLAPITVLFEFVFGIKPDAAQNVIHWHINLTERHGVERYPFGNETTLSLICEARENESDTPVVHITTDRPVTIELIWGHDSKRKIIEMEKNV